MHASVRWTIDTMHDLAALAGPRKKKKMPVRVRWKPPDSGVVKINVDAGYYDQQRQGSTGMVVRDHSGALIRGQAI